MKTIHTKAKHTEWLSAEDMHASSKIWLSELAFFKDEQLFLEDLIKSHTLQLIDKSHFEKSKDVIDRLSQVVKQTEVLFKAVTKHENELSIMVDGIDELAKEANYKKEHRNLIELIGEFKKRYQKIKAELFAMVKEVIQESKQNRLIEKQ
jgi:hypothetical protein